MSVCGTRMRSSPITDRPATTARLFSVFFLLAISACGGGGDSGSGGGGGSLRVTLSTTSLSWSYFLAAFPAAQTVTATITGTYDGEVYAAAVVENDGATNAINPNISLSLNNTQATAVVAPVANLPTGTYTGRVRFLACSDSACNRPIGGTPLTVPFTVTVKTPVQSTPNPLHVTAVSGSPFSQAVAVQPGTGETSFSAMVNAAFIRMADTNSAGFTLNLPSLPAGVHTDTIDFTGNLGSRSSLTVNYTVQMPPGGQHGIAVSPTGLTFSATEGTSSPAQTVTVDEPSWKPGLKSPVITYGLGGTGWLQLTPVTGGFSVVANAAALHAGTYQATIDIEANPLPSGIADPTGIAQFRRVNVSLTVGAGLVRPADVQHAISGDSTAGSLTGTVAVNVAGGPAIAWSAVSSDPARVTVTSNGITGTNLTYSINPDWLRDSAVNYQEYLAAITVSAPGNPAISPATFTIFIRPRIGTVTGVGPRRVVAGRATQLAVLGRGFNDLADPAARLSVSGGVIIDSVQRVHDGKLLVNVQGMASGTYDVSVGNALNKTPAVESFRVFASTQPAYATVATGAYQTTLIVDDEREALFTIDTQHSLRRYSRVAGTWTASAPATNVTNAGLMNDGSLLVTTSAEPSLPQSPATIRVLDGGNLGQVSQVSVPGGIQSLDFTVPGLPVTADNKVWLSLTPSCQGPFGNLGYYDPRDSTVHDFPLNSFPCNFQRTPEFAMSRNGERLVLWPHSQATGGVPGLPPLQYMDASDQRVLPGQSNPVINSWSNSAFASDDGSRLVIDQSRVLDGQHGFVGRLEVPYYGSPSAIIQDAEEAAAIVSPDGSRVYVLAFNAPDIGQPPASRMKPRIYVFDSTAPVAANAILPVLGYFELDDYPSCYDVIGCDRTPAAGISMDGKTLYLAGSELLIVAPIPLEQTLTPAAAMPGGASALRIRTQPWLDAGSTR